jgi:hypothetical protein
LQFFRATKGGDNDMFIGHTAPSSLIRKATITPQPTIKLCC